MRIPCHNRAGFTLLELVCTIGVVALLSGLLLPSLRSSRLAAVNSATRARYAGWVAAIESYRAEYGRYPAFHPTNLVNGGVSAGEHVFHDILAGRRRDGSALVTGTSPAAENPRALAFHRFDGELDGAGNLQDAAGNTAMAVLVDRDLDGFVRAGIDFPSLPPVDGLVPTITQFPPEGIRGGVVVYGPAAGAAGTIVLSWK